MNASGEVKVRLHSF